MASIYRKSAPRMLAWLDIQYISPAQACMASIYRKSAPCRLAWLRRSLRQRQAGLQGPVEVFASVKQACMASIYRKSASQDFPDLVEGAGGELWAEVAGER